MTRARLAALAALTAALCVADPAHAQYEMPDCSASRNASFSVVPGLFDAPDFSDRLGVTVKGSACATEYFRFRGKPAFAGFAVKLERLFGQSEASSQDLSEARISLIAGRSFTSITRGPSTSISGARGGVTNRRGFLEIAGTAAYQETIDQSERVRTLGAEARYGNSWRPWVPTLVARWERVSPVRSEARRLAGVPEDDTHDRFTGQIYLRVPVLRGSGEDADRTVLSLEGDAHAFRTRGLDPELLEATDGWESGVWGGLTLRLHVEQALGAEWLKLSDAWVRVSGGENPLDEEGAKVRAGLEIGIGEQP